MGLNTCRIIWGGLRARDLDVFDELGILVQQEHYGAVAMADTAEMPSRFDHSIAGVIRRDRNHPSIVLWCLLNEINAGLSTSARRRQPPAGKIPRRHACRVAQQRRL